MTDRIPLGCGHYPKAAVIPCIWTADAAEAPIRITLNGARFEVRQNVEYDAAEPVFEALDNSGFRITRLAAEESPPVATADAGDGAGDFAGGEAPGAEISPAQPSEPFDPDAIINGTVDVVRERLRTLNADQIAAVRAAEIDRELPRKGVIDAIETMIGITQD